MNETALLHVTIELIVIIAVARMAGHLARYIGQPAVCGEIAAGLILGPSLFGKLSPSIFHAVFDPAVGPVFTVLSQLGLVLTMFLIGLEFDFQHLRGNGRTAVSVSLSGVVVPFCLGFGLGNVMHAQLGLTVSALSFSLFMATAMSITAIPVLARILVEMNITRTKVGSLTISAAAMDDAIGWTLLALVTAVVRSSFDPAKLGIMVVEVILYVLAMISW